MQSSDKKTFKIITTDDGSPSFHSNIYNEGGHSSSGAKNETIAHYIEGCKVVEKAKTKINENSALTIFEVGFGIGIGFKETISALSSSPDQTNYFAIEIDENLILHLIETDPMFKKLEKVEFGYKMDHENCSLSILLGDARVTVPSFSFKTKFDVIYQDAFSPKRNAKLWTVEWFELLKNLSNNECLMSTYSSSSAIRKSLLQSGWVVTKGISFGPKRSSTRASLVGTTDQDILSQLERSHTYAITDANADQYTIEKTHEKK